MPGKDRSSGGEWALGVGLALANHRPRCSRILQITSGFSITATTVIPRLQREQTRRIELLQDPQSTSYYAFLARRILEAYQSPELIFRALSETKEEARLGKIRRSRGAFFVDTIKRYCAEHGVSLKPKSPARI